MGAGDIIRNASGLLKSRGWEPVAFLGPSGGLCVMGGLAGASGIATRAARQSSTGMDKVEAALSAGYAGTAIGTGIYEGVTSAPRYEIPGLEE